MGSSGAAIGQGGGVGGSGDSLGVAKVFAWHITFLYPVTKHIATGMWVQTYWDH